MTRLSLLQFPRPLSSTAQLAALTISLGCVLAAGCGGSHTTRSGSDGGAGGAAGASPGGSGGAGSSSGGTGAASGATGGAGVGGTSGSAGSGASAGDAGQSSGGAAGGIGGTGGAGGVLLCGNGQLDPGESCDPSIPAPQADGSVGGASGAAGTGAAGVNAGGSGGAAGSGAGVGGSSAGGAVGGTGGSAEGGSAAGGAATGGSAGSASGGTAGSAGGTAGSGGVPAFGQCVTLSQCPAPSSACMQPVLTGSPSSCDVECAEGPITQCADDDGCCAPGCAPNEDNDCQGWSCHPEAPLDTTRYTAMEGLSKDALRAALLSFVSGHTSLGYDGARDYMFNTLDVHSGELECVYTGRLTPPNGTRTPGGFNTEHTWPQSMGADKEPAHSDLHHLFPTDAGANSARSNWPFGDTLCVASACPYFNGGSERGTNASGATVWEVRPANRGDTARAMLYFSVRYAMPLDAAQEGALRAWHCEDPPDDRERGRNDGIDAVQHNRNPFIDRPDFVDRLLDF